MTPTKLLTQQINALLKDCEDIELLELIKSLLVTSGQ